MQFERLNAPHIRSTASVPRIMLQVLLALVPAAVAHVWFFGPGFLFNLIIATGFCVASEAAMMAARGRPPEDVTAIAIETGIQNTGVSIFILWFTLDHPLGDMAGNT